MTIETLYAVAGIIGLIVTLAWVKRALPSHTVTIAKVTEDGESVQFQTNFTLFDSAKKKAAKLQELFDMADGRRRFIAERFQQRLEEARAEQQATNIREVK